MLSKPNQAQEIICANDCLDKNQNVQNKFKLVSVVYKRAKELDAGSPSYLSHFINQDLNNHKKAKEGSIETAIKEIYFGLQPVVKK